MNTYYFSKILSLLPIILLMGSVTGTAVEEKETNTRSFMALPVIGYSTDTGFIGGAAAIKSYNRHLYRLSTIGASATYTVKHQSSISVFIDHYFPGEKYRLYASLVYIKYPTYFYGLGNDSPNDNPEKFIPEYFSTRFFLERRLKGPFKAKIGMFFHNQALVEYVRGGAVHSPAVPLNKGRLDAGAELSLVWDSRDNTIASFHGSLLQVTYNGIFVQDTGGSYNQTKLEGRKFFNPVSDLVFAFMFEAADTRGHAPFYLYPYLGGNDRLRGYEYGRFLDRSELLVQHDIRFPLYGPFSGAVFAAVGRVGPDFGSLFSGGYHSAFGAGVRWWFNREDNLLVSFDYAIGSDSNGVYFNFGEAY